MSRGDALGTTKGRAGDARQPQPQEHRMQTALTIAAVAAVILAVTLAVALPRSYTVERSIDISAPPSDVFRAVAVLRNRASWSPWHAKDPNASFVYSGRDGAVGSRMDFDGKQAGTGSVTVLAVDEGKALDTQLDFQKPFQMVVSDRFRFEHTATGTRVTWTNSAKLESLGNRAFGLMADRVLGPDYESGLATLKAVLERSSQSAALVVPAH
jgi:uncharacterized protein YndB with AHSA1/START domain